MFRFNTCLFIIILFFSSYSYSHTQNIYVTNVSSNTISVFGFNTNGDLDSLYRQSIWQNPDRLASLYAGITVNPFTNKQAYIFTNGLKMLSLDEEGNISKTAVQTPQPSKFSFVQSMVFGPYSEEVLRNKLYIFGTDFFDKYLIQIFSSDIKGDLKSQTMFHSNDGAFPDTAVFAKNINGSTNAYIISHTFPIMGKSISDLTVFSMNMNGNLFLTKQFIQGRYKYNSIATTSDEYSRFLFMTVAEQNLVEVYERNLFDGKLQFLYSKVSDGVEPIKVISSNDGHFIFVLYAGNNSISVFSVPRDDRGYVTLLKTYKLADNLKGMKGKIADGAFGVRYDNKYLYVLLDGDNLLLSYAVGKDGKLTPAQSISTGGYGSAFIELRNVQ